MDASSHKDRLATAGPGRQPLYAALATLLIQDIRDGKYRPLSTLPTEKELGERYGVSRQTVRQALRSVRDLGLISSHEGRRRHRDLDRLRLGSGGRSAVARGAPDSGGDDDPRRPGAGDRVRPAAHRCRIRRGARRRPAGQPERSRRTGRLRSAGLCHGDAAQRERRRILAQRDELQGAEHVAGDEGPRGRGSEGVHATGYTAGRCSRASWYKTLPSFVTVLVNVLLAPAAAKSTCFMVPAGSVGSS